MKEHDRKVVFSGRHGSEKKTRTDWLTPQPFFATLNREFRFNLDPAADPVYILSIGMTRITEAENAFKTDWPSRHRAYINPPYTAATCGDWIQLACTWAMRQCGFSVFLLPARTSTAWYYEALVPVAEEIRLIPGRLSFGVPGETTQDSAPFPSLVAVITDWSARTQRGNPKTWLWDWRTECAA